VQDFTIFRALGLAFRSWGRNIVSITLLAGVLFAYPLYVVIGLDTSSPDAFFEDIITFARYGMYIMLALFAMLPPLLTYKIVQGLNGARVSMLTSVMYGLRAIPILIVLAIIDMIAGFLPFPGDAILQLVLATIYFVASPAAVAERILNPFTAMSRSSFLTDKRRWGIFGLILLLTISIYIFGYVYLVSMISGSSADDLARFKLMGAVFLGFWALFQTFKGIVQAVSYVLLRQDKEGITNDELASVFE